MRALLKILFVSLFVLSLSYALKAGTSPCSATVYQITAFNTVVTYNLDNGSFTGIADPACGDYQGQDFWVEFVAPASGLVNVELLDGSITDAAMEVYWNACSGLATSVGCYSNRACGAIEMPGASLEVIPGETYHVRIFQEGGGTGSLSCRMVDLGGTDFTVGGSAFAFTGPGNQNCFQLTPETNNQVGCAWFETPIDFTSAFEINYQLNFGDDDAGADGIAFVFHTNPNPTCTNAGGQLGFVGIGNSFIVEFDTYFNAIYGDIPDDHVAININGVIEVPVAAPVSIGTNGDVEDGLPHDVRLAWDPNTDIFQVYFDGQLMISTSVATLTGIFAAGVPVYWGVTASTGGAVNSQTFCFDGFSVENSNSVENNIEAKICEGDPYIFGDNNQVLFDEGEYVEVFPASNGCDSTVTLTLTHIELAIEGIEEVELPCGDDASVVQLAALVTANVDESDLSFEWSTEDGSFDSGIETLTPIVSAVGTYTLTVETIEEGCEADFTAVVTIAPPPVVFTNGGYLGCEGDTTQLFCNGDPDVEVSWSTQDGTFAGDSNIHNPMVSAPGTYTVTVIDNITGCTNTAEAVIEASAEVDPGPSFIFCNGELSEVILEGSVSGDDILSYQWEPAAGLDNPTSLNPRVLDLTFAQSFTLTACRKAGPNLIMNGDFGLGDSAFTSDYTSGSGTPGQYMITNDPSNFFGGFDDCDDHSLIDDQMMVVDGHQTADQNIWCQEVEVDTEKTYVFSAWFVSLCQNCGSNNPVIAYTIDGVGVNAEPNEPIIIESEDCSWEQFNSEVWTPTNPVVEICISDLTTASNGNDFAIDDIELFEVCCGLGGGACDVIPEEEVEVNIDDAEIKCQADQILDLNAIAMSSDPDNVIWSWGSTDGMVVTNEDSATPTIQGPGTYSVTVTNALSGCSSINSIVVPEGTPDYPTFSLDAPPITCVSSGNTTISISGLDPNETYDFSWDGGAANGDGSIEVSSAGEYTVTVTNAENCETIESILVMMSQDLPTVNIAPIAPLTCKDEGQLIDLIGSYVVNNNEAVALEWSTIDGILVGAVDGENAQAMGEGLYTLTVINLENGCENSAPIQLDIDITPPEANISLPATLSCDLGSTDLIINSPAGSDYSYEWSANGGGQSGAQIQASAAGQYLVTVTDNATGCTAELNTFVTEELTPPAYTTNTPDIIDCLNPQVELSISGADLSFEWITNPNIVSGLNDDNVTVTDAGQYEVIVTNTTSGCTELVSLSALADFAEPDVDAGAPLTFGCTDTEFALLGSSNANGVSAEWQTAGGVIVSGGSTFEPSIGGAGTYYLTVTGDNGCSSRDSVIISADTDLPIIDAPESLVLDCNSLSVMIDATGSSNGPDFTIEWRDASGNIISDFNTLNPTIQSAGNYQLTIINNTNNCDASTFVEVTENFDAPLADVTDVPSLSCVASISTFGLDLNNADWIYAWSNDNGAIENEDQFQIETNTPGLYILQVIDQTNGCESEFTFTLNSSADTPSIDIAGDTQLSCIENEIELTVSTDAVDPTFEWTTMDGNIVNTNTEDNIQVNSAGDYTVVITDGLSGCTTIGVYGISQNTDSPVVSIPAADDITCVDNEVMLSAMIDNGGTNLAYEWTTDDGILASPNGAANISAGSEGTYTLTVTNLENGCEGSTDIFVAESISTFVIEIEVPDRLNCDITETALSVAPLGGANIQYVWTTNDGNIVSGEDNVNPLVNQAGDYILTVTDTDNGCTAQSTIMVEQDGNVPVINVEPSAVLNCENEEVIINADGSSQGNEYILEWNVISGNIISGQNSLTPIVNEPGVYELIITNQDNNCVLSQEVTIVSDNEKPDIEILPYGRIDCDNPSVSLQCVYNGQGNVAYQWIGPNGLASEQSTVEMNETGNISVEVTNLENGCSSILEVLVEGNENVPQVSISPPGQIDCLNSEITIQLDLPADAQNLIFSWNSTDGQINGAEDQSEIIVTSEGTYEVTVTDIISNCEVVLFTSVENLSAVPALDFIIPDTITCTNPKSVINTQTDQNGLIYVWETTNGVITSETNGEDVVVGTAGSYTLTVRDPSNNCENKITVEVFEDVELPDVDLQPALELTCLIMEQSLSADGSSIGPEFLYQWTTQAGQILSGESSLFPLISAPGYYALQITNTENNCVQTDSILITENTVQPLAQISTPTALDCVNEVVSINSDLLTSPTLVMEWTTVGGNILSDPSEPSITVDAPGFYELEIFDTTNGCDNTLSATVEQNILQPALALSSGFTITCDIQDGMLIAEPLDAGTQLTWLNPQNEIISTEPGITVNESGIYTAIAFSTENGCETIQTVEVLRNENIPSELIAEINPPLCFGDQASITLIDVDGGEAPYLYSTDGGQTYGDLQVLENLPAGSVHEILVQDSNGCELLAEYIIPEVIDIDATLPPLVELNLGDSYDIQVQTNFNTSDIETIIWTPTTGLSCTDCLNPSVTPNTSIDYQVEIITFNGCAKTADIQFRIDKEVKVYIPNAFSPFNFDGFNDSFYVYAKENLVAKIQSLQIFDRWGNQVFVNEDFAPNESSGGWNGRYRNEKMQAGVYVYYTTVEYFDGTTELFKGNVTLME